jgi:hypothetical protein
VEVYKLVDKIVEEITHGNYYSELPPEHLKDCIFEYLNDEYNKMISELGVYFELKKMAGYDISDKEYDFEFDKVKFKMIQKMEEVSRSK